MRFLSKCMTLSAAGLLALGATSVAAAQQQPRDSSIETGAVTDSSSTVSPSSLPSATPDSTVSGMRSDTTPSAVSSDSSSPTTGAVSPSSTENPSSVSSPSPSVTDTGMVKDSTKSNVSTDTALKAKPGLQTGQAASDTGGAGVTDTSTKAHKHHKKGAKNYNYNGAPSDSALHAKPGTQTGKSGADSATARPDSSH